MSFLFGGAPKMSSAEKIAAAETEVEMISDMFNRYVGNAATQNATIAYTNWLQSRYQTLLTSSITA